MGISKLIIVSVLFLKIHFTNGLSCYQFQGSPTDPINASTLAGFYAKVINENYRKKEAPASIIYIWLVWAGIYTNIMFLY